ncbi:MAG: TonB-dependent receptor plug domain-containing protein, partial [Holophagales bacterium]|nr:TonB-dependent receptor plug domain-containing protein [Holophagales bacterium]
MTTRVARAAGTVAAAALTALLGGPHAAAQSVIGSADDPLDEIVVTATRRGKPLLEVAASVTVQDVAELRAKGFNYGTDEFRGVPGVFFRRGEGDGEEFPFISIRGVTGNHGNDTFLALVDGIPFVG